MVKTVDILKNMKTADRHRIKNEIETIDKTLIELINKRLLIAKELSNSNDSKNVDLFDAIYDKRMIRKLCKLNEGPLSEELLRMIFSNIAAAARSVQKPLSISYLGPEATFTHIAAMNHFGHTAIFIPETTIYDIFQSVEKRECHFGVVPVENSIEGSVNHTLDRLFISDVKICAEKYLSISHDLLSLSSRLEDIKVVYSHPQPIAQCRRWLRDNLPGIALQECSSTAFAARKAATEAGAAAIASNLAAQVYNIPVVASQIEDFSKNMTRFLVIGHEKSKRTDRDKTSIMFVTAHHPGALFRVLEPIADSGVNMLKLESRPIKQENWNYFFFIDLEGHIDDHHLISVVEEMKKLCLNVKILGSYAMAPRVDTAG